LPSDRLLGFFTILLTPSASKLLDKCLGLFLDGPYLLFVVISKCFSHPLGHSLELVHVVGPFLAAVVPGGNGPGIKCFLHSKLIFEFPTGVFYKMCCVSLELMDLRFLLDGDP
jgi:hypothetical protein